jgi:hypothetical protein
VLGLVAPAAVLVCKCSSGPGVLLLGSRPSYVADTLGLTAGMEEATALLADLSKLLLLDGVHHVACGWVHPAVAKRAASERLAFGHARESRFAPSRLGSRFGDTVRPGRDGRTMYGDPPEPGDLIRLTAIIELLLTTAERVDGELVDEALIAELYELRDRAHSELQRLEGH